MAIKNYTTSIAPQRTAAEITAILAKHGASRITSAYDTEGTLTGITFELRTEYGLREFELPIRAAGVLRAMQKDKSVPARLVTEDQAARVAWRIAKDWLDSQTALIEAGLAEVDEILLPYMLTDSAGTTVYEMVRGRFLSIESVATPGGDS